MTSERLKRLIDEDCLRRRRRDSRAASYRGIARFLGVQPITLRRWLRGERPVPRHVEVIFEIFHRWPEVTSEAVDNLIRERDEASVT